MSAMVVYLMAELNNRYALLRTSTRIISSLTAMLLATLVPLHAFQSAHIVLLAVVFSFFPLFSTYQTPSPISTFLISLSLSLASYIFPQVLVLLPVTWLCQIYMRGMSFRCFVASFIGVITPYWLLFGILLYREDIESIRQTLAHFTVIESPDYSGVTLLQIGEFVYLLLFLLVGIVNFMFTSYRDKTRPRILYQVVSVQSLAVLAMLGVWPQHCYVILPLLLVDAAIMGGRFIAHTYNRFSYIFCIVMMVVSVVLMLTSLIV
jgi:hypothetical protein